MAFGWPTPRKVVIVPGSAHFGIGVGGGGGITRLPSVMAYSPIRLARGQEGPVSGPLAPDRLRVLSLGEEALVPAKPGEKQKYLAWAVEGGEPRDPYVVELVLRALLKKQGVGRLGRMLGSSHCRWVLPPTLSEKGHHLYRNLALTLGFRVVERVDLLLAAAQGGGLDIAHTGGSVVLEIGADRTLLGVFSLGERVTGRNIPFGGRTLDTALRQYIRDRYRLQLDARSAEAVKLKLGSLHPGGKQNSLDLQGRDQGTGIEKKIVLDDNDIRDVLVDACEPLILALQEGFEEVAPELAGDIADVGVLLTGAGAKLAGMPEFLTERTGLRFRLAEKPDHATILGALQMETP